MQNLTKTDLCKINAGSVNGVCAKLNGDSLVAYAKENGGMSYTLNIFNGIIADTSDDGFISNQEALEAPNYTTGELKKVIASVCI